MNPFTVKTNVYIKDWGKQYSDFFRWNNGIKEAIWNWKTSIPDYSGTTFHWEFIYEPNLTLKGTVNKREPKKLISKFPKFKNFEYTIEEITVNKDNKLIYLLSSKEGCWIQIGEGGLTLLTPENQEKVKHLEQEKWLQALAVDNLGKWTIDVKKDAFPKELLKYLYDTNQNTQFGSGMTKAIIKYPYIAKEYTVKGNDICLGWEQTYNGTGCDLSDKETISWNELPKRFPENKFK